ncbi:MOFRL family protein [Kamptonema cortianum]|nr:MOFRL family protein [Kamptonema cortianum]
MANNTLACRAVAQIARKAGFQPRIVTTTLSGEARVVGAQIAREIAEAPAGTCLIYGGETTVTIKGSPGKGGRNQELILAAASNSTGSARKSKLPLRHSAPTASTEPVTPPEPFAPGKRFTAPARPG